MNGPGTPLPVAAVMPELGAALASHGRALLQAPPGAGKSTGVPLALIDAPWLAGKRMLMLEPRRLAARAVAARMATQLGESPGDTVGYRTRLDTRIGPRTRIEVVTEGILARMLQRDPALEGVGLVIFDEFHERSLQADLGLAFVLDARKHLAPDLRILVMSATLEGGPVAALLDDAPIISAPGLAFPVDTHHVPRPSTEFLDRRATAAVLRALRDDDGDILVFLPGAGEIRRVARALEAALAAGEAGADVDVRPLYGDLGRADQDLAIQPAIRGRRKVVLATNIAETSLTIDGIRVVIDGGLERRARFDPRSGMSRLDTVRISQASADQRRGRAGRVAPGVCHRLWTAAEHRSLLPFTPPEIEAADLAGLALELACWGARDAAALRWLTPPPAGALAQARELLQSLGALDAAGSVTPHGRAMNELPAHPRLAHLLLRAAEAGVGGTGCALAALLGERDLQRRGDSRDSDVRTRLELLGRGADASDVDTAALRQVRRSAEVFARHLGLTSRNPASDPAEAGWLLATAWPERIARAREPMSGRFLLRNGRGAGFAGPEALAKSEFLVIPHLEGGDKDARIHLAAPITKADIDRLFAEDIVTTTDVRWDSRGQAVVARHERRLGALLLAEEAIRDADPADIARALYTGIRELGIAALPWTPDLRQWQARVRLCAELPPGAAGAPAGTTWPDVGDAALLDTLETWLAPWVQGISRAAHFGRIDLAGALQALLPWPLQQRLAELAPTHLPVPSGSRIPVDYLDGPVPSLSVRLQEVFGLTATPRIGGGHVPVLLKLLSPARRPVQLTRDLESFWNTAYHEVRKDLKGRYPRHYWPEDPRQAEPTRRVRPRR